MSLKDHFRSPRSPRTQEYLPGQPDSVAKTGGASLEVRQPDWEAVFDTLAHEYDAWFDNEGSLISVKSADTTFS